MVAKTKKKKVSEPLFVNIPEHVTVRSNVLGTSKDLLETLKSIEELRAIRSKKLSLASDLEAIMRQIKTLMGKLHRKYPHVPAKVKRAEAKPPVEDIKEEKEIEHVKVSKMSKPKSDLEKIEDEIAFLENKLSSL